MPPDPVIPTRLVPVGAYAGWTGSLDADEVARRLAFVLQMADGTNVDPCLGHECYLESPEAFDAEVRHFLGRPPRNPSGEGTSSRR